MFRITFIGIALLITDLLLFLFRMLTFLMEKDKDIQIYTLEQCMLQSGTEDFLYDFIEMLPEFLQSLMTAISEASFFWVFGIGGIVCIVIGMFKK